MKKSLSLRWKMLFAFFVVAAFLPAIGGAGYYYMKQVGQNYNHVTDVNDPSVIAIWKMRFNAMSLVRCTTFLAQLNLSEEDKKEYQGKLNQSQQDFEAAEKQYLELVASGGNKSSFDAAAEKWKTLRSLGEKVLSLTQSGVKAEQEQGSRLLTHEFDDATDAYAAEMDKLSHLESEEGEMWSKRADATEALASKMSFIFILCGFSVACLIGFFFSRALSNQLLALSDKLGTGAREVAAASTQLSASSEELSSSTHQQAAALQETSASVEEIRAMVQKNAENAKRSRDVSEKGQNEAQNGKLAFQEMMEATKAIAESNTLIMNQVTEGNQEISQITKVIAEIATKTKVINDIVFQTKLLSFNASVEAARAGEQGKGFAVVAEEVGNLAQMSGNAAKEISTMLEESLRKVDQIVKSTQGKIEIQIADGKARIENGLQVAQRCSDVLDLIVNGVAEVDQMVGEITVASQEQAQGVTEITKAMAELDQTTQQNAGVSQQAAASSTQLSSQAELLNSLVSDMLNLVHGKGSLAHEVQESTVAPLSFAEGAKKRGQASSSTPSGRDHRFKGA